MHRAIIALSIVCVTASAALAKDLCIQIDTGGFAGSQLVLKKAKVTRRSVAPVQGYFAKYSAFSNSFFSFVPLYGQSVVNSNGHMALGITFQAAVVGPGGSGNGTGTPQWISMTCTPGIDTTVSLLDSCSLIINNSSENAHVVGCSSDAAIP